MTYPFPSQPQPQAPRPMRWRVIYLVIGVLSATLGAMTAVFIPTASQNSPDPTSGVLNQFWQDRFRYQLSRPITILVMGIDQVEEATPDSPALFSGRSDTMLLVQFDPETKAVSLLSIPRDTQVEIPGVGIGKINEANYWGGPKLATDVVHQTLDQIPIHRYVRVSSGAFRELVDLLGGVDVFVPYPMSYTDNTQQLKIDLSPGWQTINGEEADQFARFRGDGYGDIGRIQRQQALMQAIRDRLTDSNVLPRLPQVIRVMLKYIDTDLSFEEILTLVNLGLNLDSDQFKMVMLPGRSTEAEEAYSSYWIMDEGGRDRILSQYFKLNSGEPSTAAVEEQGLPIDLKIAIQNASGNPKAGEKIADYLADQGFYNIYIIPQWPDQQRQTQIIVQRGDLSGAKQVKKLLGFGEVEAASTGQIGSDLTLRVGSDWVNQF